MGPEKSFNGFDPDWRRAFDMSDAPNIMQTYMHGLNGAAQSAEPMMKGAARCQIEMMTFWSRRAQAYLEIPSRLAQCRTPQDLMNEQMRFWQTAFQQYTDSSRKIYTAWMQMFTPPAMMGGFGAPPAKRERDYLSFPEVKPAQNGAAGGRAAGETGRKVA